MHIDEFRTNRFSIVLVEVNDWVVAEHLECVVKEIAVFHAALTITTE